MIFLFAAVALLLGAFLLYRSQGQRRELGLPTGDIFYQDHLGQPMASLNLRSRKYGVSGKPDCLIRTAAGIIPVELKKSARPPARGGVYPNHLIQVIGYMVMVRDHYGEEVPYGLVVYSGQTSRKVVLTEENLAWFEAVLRELRQARRANDVARSHNHRGRCGGCGVSQSYSQALLSPTISSAA